MLVFGTLLLETYARRAMVELDIVKTTKSEYKTLL